MKGTGVDGRIEITRALGLPAADFATLHEFLRRAAGNTARYAASRA